MTDIHRTTNSQPWPRISVITPSFNQARYLTETIDSVLDQNYPNLEYIVIDGGSTDGSVEIIRKYAPRLAYWESAPDKGQSHALNKGLEYATGSIIGWLNSDDTYLKGSLRKVAQTFEKHPDAVVVHGRRLMIDEESRVFGWAAEDDFDPNVSTYNIFSETAFWSRDKAGNLRFNQSLQFAMDLSFFCSLYKLGKFVNLPDYLGAFRCHSGSKSFLIAEIGRREGKQEWDGILGAPRTDEYGKSFAYRWRRGIQPLRHPILIGLPYIYRRLVLGKRGG